MVFYHRATSMLAHSDPADGQQRQAEHPGDVKRPENRRHRNRSAAVELGERRLAVDVGHDRGDQLQPAGELVDRRGDGLGDGDVAGGKELLATHAPTPGCATSPRASTHQRPQMIKTARMTAMGQETSVEQVTEMIATRIDIIQRMNMLLARLNPKLRLAVITRRDAGTRGEPRLRVMEAAVLDSTTASKLRGSKPWVGISKRKEPDWCRAAPRLSGWSEMSWDRGG